MTTITVDRTALEGDASRRRPWIRPDQIHEGTHYQFISGRAKRATAKYGVKSVSVLARKP